jgi:hypothetical protein
VIGVVTFSNQLDELFVVGDDNQLEITLFASRFNDSVVGIC